MGEWKKASCTLCSIMCGLEMQAENNRITRVRPDPDDPCSEGCCCRKGHSVRYLRHREERILYPMKRVCEGKFERVSWERAISEIAERLQKILKEYGPRALAYQGMGSFAGQMQAVSGKHFMSACGTQYHFSARAAELSGFNYSCGVLTGAQNYMLYPDAENCDILLCSGWNPVISHNAVQGARVVKRIAADPEKTLIVIDPRRSETARMADCHLAIRPGTDALLWRGMTALLLREGWANWLYIEEHIADLDKVLPWFEGIEPKEYIELCGLDYGEVRKITHVLAAGKSAYHSAPGVICGRHGTAAVHLQNIFFALCGRLLTRGGNNFNTTLLQGAHTGLDDASHWRLNYTKFPKISGMYPTACLAEEIDNDTPGHIRALFVVNSNPMRSAVNTASMERALRKPELLVTADCRFGETCKLSDYVLPAPTGFEVWEYFSTAKTYPKQYHRLGRPVIKPEGEIKELPEIWLMLYKAMGFMPELPQNLYDAARAAAEGGRAERIEYGRQLDALTEERPECAKSAAQIVSETLGRAWGPGAMGKAVYWYLLHTAPPLFRRQCADMGYAEGAEQTECVFDDAEAHQKGLFAAIIDENDLFSLIKTPDKKLRLYARELDSLIYEINPQDEEHALNNPEYPYILSAGRHTETNMNRTAMCDPGLINGHEDPGRLAINPADARRLGIAEGDPVRVTTASGQAELSVKFSKAARPGSVYIPHGHGYIYKGAMRGFNVNFLTSRDNRDRFTATPFHHYEPCRIEAVRK